METETLLFLNSFKSRRKGQSWANQMLLFNLLKQGKRQYKILYKKGRMRIVFIGWKYTKKFIPFK